MKKNRKNHRTTEISIIKILGWFFGICVLLGIVFLFTSYRVGPVRKMRGVVLLEYVGIIKDKRSDAELIRSLKSNDEIEQFKAITAMAYRRYSPENAESLLEYLKSDSGTRRVKNIAVWALGELHAPEAKEFLYSLKGNENFSQYEVDKAIKKIEGEIPKPFWRK
jgi:primase-polymerase (primpol)-like protein